MSTYKTFYIKTISLNISILLELTKWHQVQFLNDDLCENLYNEGTGLPVTYNVRRPALG